MSTAQPSPAPPPPPKAPTHTQFIHHGPAAADPPVPSSSATGRHKSKAYSSAVAATAEDSKYEAKYRDLKRKVKEIEVDNDKLKVKALTAKRAISRLKLERAILYERVSILSQNAPGASHPQKQAKIAHPELPGPTPQDNMTHHSQMQSQIHQRAPYYQAVDPQDPRIVEWARENGGMRTAYNVHGPLTVVDISSTTATTPPPPPPVHHVERLPAHIPEVSSDKYHDIPRRAHASQVAFEQTMHPPPPPPPPPQYISSSGRDGTSHPPQHAGLDIHDHVHRRPPPSSGGDGRHAHHREHRDPSHPMHHSSIRSSRSARAHAQPQAMPMDARDHPSQVLPSVQALLSQQSPSQTDGRRVREMHEYSNPPPPPPPHRQAAHHPSHSPSMSSSQRSPTLVRRAHESRPAAEEMEHDHRQREREHWEWEQRATREGRIPHDQSYSHERDVLERERQMRERERERTMREHGASSRRVPTPPFSRRHQEPQPREREHRENKEHRDQREHQRDRENITPFPSASRGYRDDPLPPPPPAPPQHLEGVYSSSGSRTNTPGTHASGSRSRRSRAESFSREYERDDHRPATEYSQLAYDTPHMPMSVERDISSVRGSYAVGPSGHSGRSHHSLKRSHPDEDEDMRS